MKSRILGLAMGVLMAASTWGADLTWDAVTGNGQADDGGGMWSPSAANWWNSSSDVVWPNTASDTAIFGANNGAAGMVAVSGTVTAAGVTFTNVGSGVYLLANGSINAATFNAATNARIGSELSGSAGLLKSGSGTLTLEGSKSYSGATVVTGGTLQVIGGAPVGQPVVWLDASDVSTVTTDATGLVSAWASKGSAACSVTSSGADRPTFLANAFNGRSTIWFNDAQIMANSTVLTAANFPSNEGTMLVVWWTPGDGYYEVVDISGIGEFWCHGWGNAYPGAFRSVRIEQAYTMPISGAHVFTVASSAAANTYRIWLDGTQKVDTSPLWGLGTTLRVGANNYTALAGYVAEVLIYNTTLSDSDRQKVEAYLNAKWLLTGSAPGTSNLLPTNTAVQVASGATLDLSGDSDQSLVSLANAGNGGGSVIVGGSRLAVGDTNDLTFAGTISGAGVLEKTGSGSLILTGTNTYAGGTVVDAGTLEVTQTGLGAIITNNGVLSFDLATDASLGKSVTGSGTLQKKGAGVLSVANSQAYGGATIVAGGTLRALAGPPVSSPVIWFDANDTSTLTTNGSGLVDAWTSKGTYSGSASAGGAARPAFTANALNGRSVIRFSDAQTLTNVGALTAANFASSNGTIFAVWSINADGNYNVVDISANGEWWCYGYGGCYPKMFRSARIESAFSTMPVNGTHLFSAVSSGTDNTYRIWLDGTQKVNTTPLWGLGTTLRLGENSDKTAQLNGDIAEVLIYNTALSDSERQSVEAYLNYKWLGVGAPVGNDVLPTNTAARVAAATTLDLSGYNSQRIASLSDYAGGGGTVAIGPGGLTVGDTNSTTFSGVVSGSGRLTKTGGGALTLAGISNSYAGGTVIQAGTLRLAQTTIPGDITNNGVLVFNLATDGTFNGTISGSGALVKEGQGALSFAGDQIYTGATVISAGTLRLGVPTVPQAAGRVVWFDASDASTVTTDATGRVSAWASKGTYTGSATSAGDNRPTFTANGLNGKSTVRFADSPQQMVDSSALTAANFPQSNATMLVVWRLGGDDYYSVVDVSPAGEWWCFAGYGNGCFPSMFRGQRINPDTTPAFPGMPASGAHLFTCVSSTDANSYGIWLDGVRKLTTNSAWTISSTMTLGRNKDNSAFLLGDIAEVLIYNTALSDAARQSVESYLSAKWGLGLSANGPRLLGSTQIVVGATGRLDLGAANSVLNTNAVLSLVTGASVSLTNGVHQALWMLYLNGQSDRMGTWGATGSGASHVNDSFFTGAGVLDVQSSIPRGSTFMVR